MKTPPPQWSAERVSVLRAHLKKSRGWSLAHFAREIHYSADYVLKLERGDRKVTAAVVKRLKPLERDQAYLAKEIYETDNEIMEWLLTALEQRKQDLSRSARLRLKKLLE
jgi:transcriptional regulator with XRE-family HTH domain